MKEKIIRTISKILGNRLSYRLGRSLYLQARHEVKNEIRSNGEENIQTGIVKRFSAGGEKLVVFDVGANVGDWTLMLLDKINRCGIDSAEIHAFEPVMSTFNLLQEQVRLHPRGNIVKCIPKACSGHEGTDKMYIFSDNAGTNSLHKDGLHPDLPFIEIEKTTIENYCSLNNILQIHFLKCDTEGHEMEVFKGAKTLFQNEAILVCQFEYNYRWVYSRHFLKDVFDLVEGLPYSIGKITGKKLMICEKWHPEIERFFEGNYLIVHDSAKEWFNIITGKIDDYGIFVPIPIN